MKKLTLKPEDLCVESFGTLALPRGRGTVQGAVAADTKAETCTCTDAADVCADSIYVCPDTWYCGDTNSPSCPHTCGIVIAYGAADAAMAPQSWDCPCM